jgi:hypothetical protein
MKFGQRVAGQPGEDLSGLLDPKPKPKPETKEDPPTPHEPGAGSSLDLSSPAGPSAGDFSANPSIPKRPITTGPDDRKRAADGIGPWRILEPNRRLLFILYILYSSASFALLLFCSFASLRRPRLLLSSFALVFCSGWRLPFRLDQAGAITS